MNRKTLATITLAGIVALGGCALISTPEIDARLGEAVNMMKAQQTLNPEASRNTEPVVGLDGKAAKGALDNYRDSFRKPPAEAPSLLGIGGGTAGGAR